MRYYLVKIYFNKEVQAEVRQQPVGFDAYDDAEKAMFKYMSDTMLASTVSWCEAFILNSQGGTDRVERWEEKTNPDDLVERIISGELDYVETVEKYPQYKDYIDTHIPADFFNTQPETPENPEEPTE